jgi:hypothetical protein
VVQGAIADGERIKALTVNDRYSASFFEKEFNPELFKRSERLFGSGREDSFCY